MDVLVAELVHTVMSPDWAPEAAGSAILKAAGGSQELLRRARIQLLKTTNPRSQVRDRALATLTRALVAAGQHNELAEPDVLKACQLPGRGPKTYGAAAAT